MRFAGELKLSVEQKGKLKIFLEEKEEKLSEVLKKNPNPPLPEVMAQLGVVRDSGREAVTKFLTPEQLEKWDAEVAEAKTFLGHRVC
jgi:hypothetical protein